MTSMERQAVESFEFRPRVTAAPRPAPLARQPASSQAGKRSGPSAIEPEVTDANQRSVEDEFRLLDGTFLEIGAELRRVAEALNLADREVRMDLSAKQRRLSDDLELSNKDVKRFREQISALQRQADEPFEFRLPASLLARPTQPGGRFVPSSTARPAHNFPDEALPEVGSLRSHKGQRYLVIETWEALDAGERAAARLKATLVAPENT